MESYQEQFKYRKYLHKLNKKYFIKMAENNQQQFAYTVVLTKPHCWHTTYVSLQLSMQQGIQNSKPVVQVKKIHHATVTDPTFDRITLSVYLLHTAHLLIFPNCIMLVMVGCYFLVRSITTGAGGC